MLKEALLKFCHNNNINVVSLLEELRKNGSQLDKLDNEPEFLKKRFINTFFNETLAKQFDEEELRAKRAELYMNAFGKDEAIKEMYEHQFMKGTPPIGFLNRLFGNEMCEDFMNTMMKKYGLQNVDRFDDYDQIALIKHFIDNELSGQFVWWKEHLPIRFAQYVKYGNKEFSIFPDNMSDDERLQHIKELTKTMENEGIKVSKDRLSHLMHQAFPEYEKAEKFLNAMIEEKAGTNNKKAVSLSDASTEKINNKIINILSDYMSTASAMRVFNDAKQKARISEIKTASYDDRKKFFNAIVNDNSIEILSVQRKSIINSWVRTWLNV